MGYVTASILFTCVCLFAAVQCNAPQTPVNTQPSAFAAQLLSEEKQLSQNLPGYRREDLTSAYSPTGIFFEQDLLWIYAHDTQTQIGFRFQNGHWRKSSRRTGPPQTTRCIPAGQTYCLGYYDGVVRMSPNGFKRVMPAAFGFTDFCLSSDGSSFTVLDTAENRLLSVSLTGKVRTIAQIGAGSYALGCMPNDEVWLASFIDPRLQVWSSQSGKMLRSVTREAPLRAAVYDAEHKLLWTIGPENTAVKRDAGPIENLRTAVYAFDATTLQQVRSVVWNSAELVDGTSLTLAQGTLYATASGSGRVWSYAIAGESSSTIQSYAVPVAGAYHNGSLFVVNSLSATVDVFSATGGQRSAQQTIRLREKTAEDVEHLGKHLFYQTGMWSREAANAYTCNSCHWNGLSDHRLHPGFHETRYELTRPVAGIGRVKQIFTPMQAESLSEAVEGLFRGLDVRFWRPKADAVPYYQQDITVQLSETESQTLSAFEARRALLTALMRWPVEPPAKRRVGTPLSQAAERGGEIFLRDCARCHEPTTDMRTRTKQHLRALQNSPLSFGAPLYAQAGTPAYTAHGNRISPLMNLRRGGPFFSNGSAADLAAVARSTNPNARAVHGTENALHPHYKVIDEAALVAFLSEI